MAKNLRSQSWKSGLFLTASVLSVIASVGLLLLYERTPDRWLVGVLGVVSGCGAFWHWHELHQAELRALHFERASFKLSCLESVVSYADVPLFPDGYGLVGKTIDPKKKSYALREGKGRTLVGDIDGYRVVIDTYLGLGQTITSIRACRVEIADPRPLTPDEANHLSRRLAEDILR